jgi:hypothetical protein
MGKKIGVSRETHLMHRLVWSYVGDAPLVAIQDVINGTVLPVLSVDMYRREYASNLTEKRLHQVLNQMARAGFAELA